MKPATKGRALACLTALLAAVPLPAAAAQGPQSTVAEAASALAELRRAASAAGAADIASIKSFGWQSEGTLYSPNQGRTPDVATEWGLRHRHFGDFASGLTYVALDFRGPESSFSRSTVLRQDSGSGDLLELTAAFPLSVLRLLADRPADLRLVRNDSSGVVIAGPVIDRVVELELGPDRLPHSLSWVIADPLFGDSVRRFEYLDYRRENGLMVPGRVRQTDAGRPAHEMRISAPVVNGARPAWSQGLEPRQAHPPGDSDGFRAERVADGIHFLKQIGGADYNALGVELSDGWVLLETPGALGDGAAVRSALKEIADKPIRYVVPTHHHDDHSSGVAAFAEDEVTVLTTPGNLAFFQTMLAAQRDFEKPDLRAKVAAVTPDQRLGPVRFVPIAALPHVQEMLLFYFPDQKLLFHSDLGRFSTEGEVEPARPQTCALLAAIESRSLEVNRIYSGHGPPGTVDDVRKAIAKRDEPCP